MFTFQQATPDDAEQLAQVVIETGEGIAEHLFDGLIPGVSALTILSAAFLKGEGCYRVENVIRSMSKGDISAVLFSYPAEQHIVPALMESFIPAKRINAVRPILERTIEDSLYINTFWVSPTLRGHGHADALMVEAESECRELGRSKISLFCWNDNTRACKFYARHGFQVVEALGPEMLSLNNHTSGGSLFCRYLNE